MYQLAVKSNLVSFDTLIVLNSYQTLSDHDQKINTWFAKVTLWGFKRKSVLCKNLGNTRNAIQECENVIKKGKISSIIILSSQIIVVGRFHNPFFVQGLHRYTIKSWGILGFEKYDFEKNHPTRSDKIIFAWSYFLTRTRW